MALMMFPVAEVADKVLATWTLWAISVIAACIAAALLRFGSWTLWLTIPLSATWIIVVISDELLDSDMREALVAEFGWQYPLRLISATLPLCAVLLLSLRLRLRSRAAHRQQRGFCVSCGYDVRLSPDRCPECGAVLMAADA